METNIYQAVISLGSNLGNSIETLKQALREITVIPNTQVIQTSSFYQTKPVGYTEQPDFINAVCEIKTTLNAYSLLEQLQLIEKKHKRTRDLPQGPRTLDLDLIDFAQQMINNKILTIPHPRAHERAFVIVPLAEILPDYPLKNGYTVSQWKKLLKQDGIQLLAT